MNSDKKDKKNGKADDKINGDSKKLIARALGQVPSGCFVLTATHGPKATGILASWVQQASFKPPMVTAAVKQGRPIQELIEASGHFVLNHISENPLQMFRHFGRGFKLAEPAFDGLSTQSDSAGLIIQECLGYLSCRVAKSVDAGDHRIYVAEIIDASFKGDGRPYVHLRGDGLQY